MAVLPALAADDPPPPPCGTAEAAAAWWNGDGALGDLCGLRPWLLDRGVTLGGSVQIDALANPTGGSRSDAAISQLGDLSLALDGGKLLGAQALAHTSLHAEFWWAAGNDLSARSIASYFDVQQTYTPAGVYIGQLYLQQDLLDDTLTLRLGRLTTNETFATIGALQVFVNAAQTNSPAIMMDNFVPFLESPAATWAAQASFAPKGLPADFDGSGIQAGVFQYNLRESELRGTSPWGNLDWQDDGYMGIAQVTVARQQADGADQWPGTFVLGALYSGGNYPDLRTGENRDGNFGFYALGQQVVYRHPGASGSEGLTPWFAVAWAPLSGRNAVYLQTSLGAVWPGIVPGRDGDIGAVAVSTGWFSEAVDDADAETVVEVAYTIQLNQWLSLTPDMQYVINPGGYSDNGGAGNGNDALIVGGQLGITF